MKSSVFIFLALAFFSLCVSAQKRVSTAAKPSKNLCQNRKLVEADKPMVYLSYVRRETVKVRDVEGDTDRLFFRLTNNFCSPIVLDMSGEHAGWGDASLYYAIEDRHSGRRVSGKLSCHVCSINPLAPGRSILFSIPYRTADRGAAMRVAYEFDFDRENSYESSNSLHTVAYYFSGLPESVLPLL